MLPILLISAISMQVKKFRPSAPSKAEASDHDEPFHALYVLYNKRIPPDDNRHLHPRPLPIKSPVHR